MIKKLENVIRLVIEDLNDSWVKIIPIGKPCTEFGERFNGKHFIGHETAEKGFQDEWSKVWT